MDTSRKATSGTIIALVVVIVVILVGFAAYALYYAPGATTVTNTQTNTATTTNTATQTSIQTATTTATSSYLPSAIVNAGGGTLVYPVMTSWIFGFTQVQPNIQVNYASIGSGAGIAQITAGTLNIGESDAPLTSAQYTGLPANSTLLTIPISASGVVPAYNIAGIASTTHLKFTGDVLAKIFLGNISFWDDPAITALNSGVTLPHNAITVIHRSDGSGTMYAYTNYLSDSNAFWRVHVGTSTSVHWPVGVGCKGNSGVAGCIQNTLNSIGPLEIAYQIQNPGSINYGSVQNHAGTYVLANLTNIASALKVGASAGLPAGNAHWTGFSIVNNIFNDSADSNIYPITTFTYALVYENMGASYAGTSMAQAVGAVNFLWWVVNSGQAAGKGLGYPPLPANVVSLDDTTLHLVNYNGTPVLGS